MIDDTRNRVYLAGPMRGYPRYNYDAFLAATTYLRTICGFAVVSPHEMDVTSGTDFDPAKDEFTPSMFAEAMRRDVAAIATCDKIVFLPGWEHSEGARNEARVGLMCGLLFWQYNPAGKLGCRLNLLGHDEVRKVLDAPPVPVNGDATPSVTAHELECEGCGWATVDDRANTAPVAAAASSSGEVRTTNPTTGGQKGVKLSRYDLIPVGPLDTVAKHYGIGASKYEDRNWEKGYEWSKSYAALWRHAQAFWGGEDIDDETGSPHLAAVVFHAFALLEWGKTHPELDDRVSKKAALRDAHKPTVDWSRIDALLERIRIQGTMPQRASKPEPITGGFIPNTRGVLWDPPSEAKPRKPVTGSTIPSSQGDLPIVFTTSPAADFRDNYTVDL